MKEQKLGILYEQYGESDDRCIAMRRKVIHEYNFLAMKALSLDKFDYCLEMIKKSETILLESDASEMKNSLSILFLNNKACCFRKRNKVSVEIEVHIK